MLVVNTSLWAPAMKHQTSDGQELNHLAKHDDAARLSVIASVAVLKSVGALECEVPVFIACRFDSGEGNRRVEELHLFQIALAAGALYGDLMDSGTVEP